MNAAMNAAMNAKVNSTQMELYPAIDVRGGRCVRLQQGDYDRETVYGDDPVSVALSFVADGAKWIHTVDLDAAKSGAGVNRPVIAAIASAVKPLGASVQTGGGVRNRDAVDELLGLGVTRVVIGTAAVEDPAFVAEVASAYPGAIAVGLDARALPDGRYDVAVRGWTEGSGVDLFALLQTFEDIGVAAAILTEISRDGMLTGPDIDGLRRALDITSIGVIASGGVSSLQDIATLASLRSATTGRSLAGAITGKAIYEGRFTVREGVQQCAS